MASERELCKVCGGNGVVKIPGGVSVCNHCEGVCWEPAPVPPSPAEAQIAALREALEELYQAFREASLDESYPIADAKARAAMAASTGQETPHE